MIIVMSGAARQAEIDAVAARIEAQGLAAHVSRGSERTVIGAVGQERGLEPAIFESMPGVERALRVVSDYRIVSREAQPEDSAVRIGDAMFGGGAPAWLGGCSHDWSRQALAGAAEKVWAAGGRLLFAGGARHDNPYRYRLFGVAEMEALAEAAAARGLAAVAELSDPRLLDVCLELDFAGLLLPPACLCNVELLREVGRVNKPVILQRNNRSTPEEWLLAAEHVAAGGNHRIVLCDCGREGDGAGLDAGELAWLHRETHLPLLVAPVAAGGAALAPALAAAALAVGASGLLLELDGDAALAPSALLAGAKHG
ncbi:3-deoxy-7-phosphoheptulonate synthase [Chromobacterium alticapitis]|uniref:3-deoxy-7-phosphoheptulonate synthase n=1 Tax=Chromobacterium alticapitis TaxID=2073169 RepID=A0A2S5DBE4_9NEIS|nr:3-deoxy-7-phosphoheptulonate synthase [Chromobacterium alticapitis]POZ60405.1 3-deoxy-7-phosphoheptulonate synthase [Chromobacterium alticapitis]